MKHSRLIRIAKSWWRLYQRYQQVSFEHYDIMTDNEIHYDDEENVMRFGMSQQKAAAFIKRRQQLEAAAKAACRRLRLKLNRLSRHLPEDFIQDLIELDFQQENDRLNAKIEEKKRLGLAAVVNGNLVVWSSLQSRRQWEQEYLEQAALIV